MQKIGVKFSTFEEAQKTNYRRHGVSSNIDAGTFQWQLAWVMGPPVSLENVGLLNESLFNQPKKRFENLILRV